MQRTQKLKPDLDLKKMAAEFGRSEEQELIRLRAQANRRSWWDSANTVLVTVASAAMIGFAGAGFSMWASQKTMERDLQAMNKTVESMAREQSEAGKERRDLERRLGSLEFKLEGLSVSITASMTAQRVEVAELRKRLDETATKVTELVLASQFQQANPKGARP